jgi:hypothetical protein
MSIRNTFLKDYGISKELGDKIVSYCRNAHDYDQNLAGRTEDLPGDIECPVRESDAWNWV